MKVVLIVLDTLRRDHLSCYGYQRNTSPNIDKFARDGIIFDNEYTSDVPTIPSFTAMLNGQLGIKTGVVSFNPTELLFNEVQSLPYILSRNGIVTAAVSTLFYMRSWFVRGFQYYMNPLAGFRERTQTVDAEEINLMAIPWLEQNYDKNFFLFVHYWDPHVESVWGSPSLPYRYKAPERFRNKWYEGEPEDPASKEYRISQYDANITYADEEIGKLLETIDDLGITDETLVIFTTDHGESLGDDHPQGKDDWDHGDIYEEIVHTPLIMRYPKIFPKGKRIDDIVLNIDIAPTILDVFGLSAPKDFDGKSLLPLINGDAKGYECVYVSCGFFTVKRAVITQEKMKFIRTFDKAKWKDAPEKELFDLKKDPYEKNNIIDEQKDIAENLEIRMCKWVDSMLGSRPDPLRLRATMGRVRPAVPYYSYVFGPRSPEYMAYTASP